MHIFLKWTDSFNSVVELKVSDPGRSLGMRWQKLFSGENSLGSAEQARCNVDPDRGHVDGPD